MPAPEAVAVPRLPTLWEWTPTSGVAGERKGQPEAIVPGPEDTMPSMVAHDFAADQDAHDFAADRDVAAAPRRTSRRYPMEAGEEGKHDGDVAAAPRRTSRRYPMVTGEEGKHDGGVNYNDGYDSIESFDDDRDGDFVP